MKLLTPEQLAEIKQEMVGNTSPDACIVRFMENGRTVANLTTGELHSRGINIINMTHYWNFTKATAQKIAGWTETKAVFSD